MRVQCVCLYIHTHIYIELNNFLSFLYSPILDYESSMHTGASFSHHVSCTGSTNSLLQLTRYNLLLYAHHPLWSSSPSRNPTCFNLFLFFILIISVPPKILLLNSIKIVLLYGHSDGFSWLFPYSPNCTTMAHFVGFGSF